MNFQLSPVSAIVYQDSMVDKGRPQDDDVGEGVTSIRAHWGIIDWEFTGQVFNIHKNWLHFKNRHRQIKARFVQLSFLINI